MREERRAVVREISQIFQRMTWVHRHDTAARLAERGMTSLQFSALWILDREGPEMPIGAIGEAMLTPASSMTSVVDRLVDLDLVERAPHPSDRRTIVVRITGEGRDLVREIEGERLETVLRLLDGVSDEHLSHFLARLRQFANDAAEPPRTRA
ncbi:MAG: MarR family winged helix-turn-helix transcriptional regulator [Thermomicrobiales bacterium]